jgi:hypothetical protein
MSIATDLQRLVDGSRTTGQSVAQSMEFLANEGLLAGSKIFLCADNLTAEKAY